MPIGSDVLLKFIAGGATANDIAVVGKWLEDDPSHRAELDLLERAWKLSATSRSLTWDTGRLWDRIEVAIESDASRPRDHASQPLPFTTGRTLTLMPPVRRSWWTSTPARVAAAALLAAAAVLVAIPGRVDHSSTVAGPSTVRTFATQRGERAEIRLPDGSRVVLNAASVLRMPVEFGKDSRELYLDGEAYFEVKHDATRPFNIHTARGITQDLGTRFVIVAYGTDTSESVAVGEGSVSLRGTAAAPVVLRAGDVGRVSRYGVASREHHGNTDKYFNWLDGVIQFDNTTLAEAVPILERQFDLNIHLTDTSLARKRFTGSFTAGDIDQLMKGLAFLLDARYVRSAEGHDLTLAPR